MDTLNIHEYCKMFVEEVKNLVGKYQTKKKLILSVFLIYKMIYLNIRFGEKMFI